MEISNNTRKYSFKLSDVADMVQEFANEIEDLEEELNETKSMLGCREVDIDEKNSEIAYLKSILDGLDIAY